jgi:hypothetical protein
LSLTRVPLLLKSLNQTVHRLIQHILPSESFIAFNAFQIATPTLVWARDASAADDYLDRFGFCVPLPDELPELYGQEQIEMLAERYGGPGISINGGGVRCGNVNGFQIKGVGPTELAGVGADYWHSYGGASLKEALRETIWGEVFNQALPFGAVTVEAIIVINGSEVELPYPASNGKKTCPRALIIRPQFVRPAHYLRAPLFRPSQQFKASNVTDTERTQAAIQSLRAELIHILAATPQTSVVDLLTQTYQRYAAQVAAARAKRLFHGSLSASNIALDGRLVDFGMSSSVSDHGRIIITRGCPDAWMQHSILAGSIHDLAFFIRKYSNLILDHIEVSRVVMNAFQRTLDDRFAVEILKLTGVPEQRLLSLSNSELQQFFKPFLRIIEAGNREPFKLLSPCPDYVPCMPTQMGRYHLSTCIRLAILASTKNEANTVLTDEIPEATLRQAFVESIWGLQTLYLAERDAEAASRAIDFLKFNAFRLNTNISSLYAYNLNSAIDDAIASGDNLQSFILQTVRGAVQWVQDVNEQGVWIESNDIQVFGKEELGLVCNSRSLSFSELSERFPNSFSLPQDRKAV